MCSVVRATAGASLRCGAMIVIGVVAVLAAQTANPATTTPRPVPVDRDHRGDSENYVGTSLKPPGARRDPGWGNYGNGKGDGAIVRDHRH